MPRRDVFPYAPLVKGLIGVGAAICVWGLLSEYSMEPTKRRILPLYGFGILVVFCMVALAQVIRGRIELRADEIRVVELLGHKSYPRAAVVAARWEKGGPVSLQLRDGTWAKLPDTGRANTKVAGAIRAWLDETTAEDERGGPTRG